SDNINKVTKGFKLSTVEGIGGFAAYSIAQGFAQSVMQQAAYGGSYIDNLGNAMAGQARNLGMAGVGGCAVTGHCHRCSCLPRPGVWRNGQQPRHWHHQQWR
ncbi:hypothetical protein IPC615_34230, partial [Pseudomonas aeruginosa]|uniref:DUF637 domain-containing protein n=1 Tax=Pseudomonas aeruginosa TaxID=287 RepID=UPI0010679CF7